MSKQNLAFPANGAPNGTSGKKHTSDPNVRRKTPMTTKATKRNRDKLQKPPPKRNMSPVDRLASFIIDNQISLSLTILGIIHAADYVLPSSPSSPSITQKISSLNYYNPATGQYKKGPADLYLVFYWIVVFTLLRDAAMQYLFKPYAKYGGIQTYKELVRFAEQAWLMVYYIVFWTLGMYLNYHSPHWMNFGELWKNWPITEASGLFKWYYLAQLAFWLQQLFVLHIEDRRKDHYQMLAHHIITSLLIIASYLYHFLRVGNTILCTMDLVDILLPAAKLLRYLGYQKLCDVAFGIFFVTWIVSRHIVYNAIVKSVYGDVPIYITYGCYSIETGEKLPDITGALSSHFLGSYPDRTCFTRAMHYGFVGLLVALQLITILWLYMIGKVAYKVITGTGAEDTRSDDEEDEEEDFEEEIHEVRSSQNGEIALKRADSGYISGSTGSSALSSLIMNGNGHSGSTHRHITSKLDGRDMH